MEGNMSQSSSTQLNEEQTQSNIKQAYSKQITTQSRLFSIDFEHETNPFLINPRHSLPFRQLFLNVLGWQFLPEAYGMIIPLEITEISNITSAIHDLDEFIWKHKEYFCIYAKNIHNSKSYIGAVLIRMPIPTNYSPKLFERKLAVVK